MSTQPIGIHNPEAMGNNNEGYAELLLNRIQNAQAESNRTLLNESMEEYTQFCKERGIKNELETTVN